MLTVTRIKPCPFCDWEDVEVDEVDKGLYAICCPECECMGPICGSVEAAINMWNGAGGRACTNEYQKAWNSPRKASKGLDIPHRPDKIFKGRTGRAIKTVHTKGAGW